jgi:hypothetical protein
LLLDALMIATRAALAMSDGDHALRHARSALVRARAEAIDADSSSSVGEALLLEAQALARQGELSRAASLAHEAISHLQENLGRDHTFTLQAKDLAKS